MTEVEIVVPGQPVALQRHRHRGNRTYLPKESVEFRERVQAAWMCEGRPQFGDKLLTLTARFFFERPPSHVLKSGRLAKGAPSYPPKVDTSNLVKACEDALNGLAYVDDSQVVTLERCEKLYADRHEEPRTELELRAL